MMMDNVARTCPVARRAMNFTPCVRANRRGDEKSLRHLCGHTAQRTAVEQAPRLIVANMDCGDMSPLSKARHLESVPWRTRTCPRTPDLPTPSSLSWRTGILPVGPSNRQAGKPVFRDSQDGYLPSGLSTKRALSSTRPFLPSSCRAACR
jgi:hypothetical protein